MDAATSKAPVPLFTVVVVAHVPVAGAAGPAGTHVLELPDRSKGGTDPGLSSASASGWRSPSPPGCSLGRPDAVSSCETASARMTTATFGPNGVRATT